MNVKSGHSKWGSLQFLRAMTLVIILSALTAECQTSSSDNENYSTKLPDLVELECGDGGIGKEETLPVLMHGTYAETSSPEFSHITAVSNFLSDYFVIATQRLQPEVGTAGAAPLLGFDLFLFEAAENRFLHLDPQLELSSSNSESNSSSVWDTTKRGSGPVDSIILSAKGGVLPSAQPFYRIAVSIGSSVSSFMWYGTTAEANQSTLIFLNPPTIGRFSDPSLPQVPFTVVAPAAVWNGIQGPVQLIHPVRILSDAANVDFYYVDIGANCLRYVSVKTTADVRTFFGVCDGVPAKVIPQFGSILASNPTDPTAIASQARCNLSAAATKLDLDTLVLVESCAEEIFPHFVLFRPTFASNGALTAVSTRMVTFTTTTSNLTIHGIFPYQISRDNRFIGGVLVIVWGSKGSSGGGGNADDACSVGILASQATRQSNGELFVDKLSIEEFPPIWDKGLNVTSRPSAAPTCPSNSSGGPIIGAGFLANGSTLVFRQNLSATKVGYYESLCLSENDRVRLGVLPTFDSTTVMTTTSETPTTVSPPSDPSTTTSDLETEGSLQKREGLNVEVLVVLVIAAAFILVAFMALIAWKCGLVAKKKKTASKRGEKNSSSALDLSNNSNDDAVRKRADFHYDQSHLTGAFADAVAAGSQRYPLSNSIEMGELNSHQGEVGADMNSQHVVLEPEDGESRLWTLEFDELNAPQGVREESREVLRVQPFAQFDVPRLTETGGEQDDNMIGHSNSGDEIEILEEQRNQALGLFDGTPGQQYMQTVIHSTSSSRTGDSEQQQQLAEADTAASLRFLPEAAAQSNNKNNNSGTTGGGRKVIHHPLSRKTVLAAIKEGKWEKGKMLGRGSFGCVYSATLTTTGKQIAVKELFLPVADVDINDTTGSSSSAVAMREVAHIEEEMRMLSDMVHPHLLQYYSATWDTEAHALLLFTELCEGGSLGSLVRSMKDPLPEEAAARFTAQILSGLDVLHRKGVVHRDIKSDNVLLTVNGVAKIADFGTTRKHRGGVGGTFSGSTLGGGGLHTLVGTPAFIAPEVLGTPAARTQKTDGEEEPAVGYGRKADIWSLGITVIEMMNRGNHSWPRVSQPGVLFLHISEAAEGPPIPQSITSPEIIDFIQLCCQRDPAARPSASELLTHPWIKPSK